MNRPLAVLGGAPAFPHPVHVGRPNIGNRAAFYERVDGLLDRRWLSNDGPLVRELEQRLAEYLGVEHCVAMVNATVGLEIAIRALDLTGEVLMPSFTFIATAHALEWQGIRPVFVDVDPVTHTIDPAALEARITPRTTGILGVHVWGSPCDTDAIAAVADRAGLRILYDAAHALGVSRNGSMIGGFGSCEVFSFHATKFLNSFEGGAITTNDSALAERLRLMRNFGFAELDRVVSIGVNGKMTEVCAAMGLTSLEEVDRLIATNKANYDAYGAVFCGLDGVSLFPFARNERNNYQYVVLQVDRDRATLNRDELIAVLRAENVLARRYFWPGCHRMEPYQSREPEASLFLPQTERVAGSVIVLPTGQAVSQDDIEIVGRIIRSALENPHEVRAACAHPST